MSGTNQPYSYITGVVTFARPAVIKDENEMGTWLGGAIGYILGSLFGRGKGNTLATVGGTLGGALIGHEIDKGNGQEIGVRLADGSEIVIVVKTNEVFQPGDMIRIIKSGDRIIRVEHM
jgi:outer membrane lipoprotein SlyB